MPGTVPLRPLPTAERLAGEREGEIAMETTTRSAAPSIRNQVSSEEWEARVNLAAAYRLVALYGWDDLVFTHISARVPGAEHHFLLNPYGMMFDEVTASSLIKVD